MFHETLKNWPSENKSHAVIQLIIFQNRSRGTKCARRARARRGTGTRRRCTTTGCTCTADSATCATAPTSGTTTPVSTTPPTKHQHCRTLGHFETKIMIVNKCSCGYNMSCSCVPVSRVWSQVRTPAKLSPSARSGHAGLRAGAHLYIFGGETHGHSTNELWRFHFGNETPLYTLSHM